MPFGFAKKTEPAPLTHYVNGRSLYPPFPEGSTEVLFGMGCFWGAERLFWNLDGVIVTMVGYSGGQTPDPTYEEVCTGKTGHCEVVRIVHDPRLIGLDALLTVFFEGHDPTQVNRQGNDIGTQYRSAIYLPDEGALALALTARDAYQEKISARGFAPIATQIATGHPFTYAESYHQQYLAKTPSGYCGLRGLGVRL